MTVKTLITECRRLQDALGEGIWLTVPDDFPEDRKTIETLYQKSLKALGVM